MKSPSEIAKEIVAKFRENERIHTDEWDESRYLEQKIQSSLTSHALEVSGPLVIALKWIADAGYYRSQDGFESWTASGKMAHDAINTFYAQTGGKA